VCVLSDTKALRAGESTKKCLNENSVNQVVPVCFRLLKVKSLTFPATIWNHLEPSGTIWNYLEPSGTIWNYLELSGTIWNHLEPSGTIWNHLELSGTIWNHLEPSGTIWNHLELSGTIWNHLEPSGTIWNYLEPSGTIWNHLELSPAFLHPGIERQEPKNIHPASCILTVFTYIAQHKAVYYNKTLKILRCTTPTANFPIC
jgi:hypothetical protein